MENHPNTPANHRRLRTLPGHVAYVTGNRGPDQDAISVTESYAWYNTRR